MHAGLVLVVNGAAENQVAPCLGVRLDQGDGIAGQRSQCSSRPLLDRRQVGGPSHYGRVFDADLLLGSQRQRRPEPRVLQAPGPARENSISVSLSICASVLALAAVPLATGRHQLLGLEACPFAARACLRSEGPEPFADGGDVEGGLVADGELVVAGGDGAVALEPVDAALDGVALLVLSLSKAGGLPPELPFFLRFATWSFFSGMVQRIPWLRSQARLARAP